MWRCTDTVIVLGNGTANVGTGNTHTEMLLLCVKYLVYMSQELHSRLVYTQYTNMKMSIYYRYSAYSDAYST